MVHAQLSEVCDVFGTDNECGALECVKAASEIYSPVCGTVGATSEGVEDKQALNTSDEKSAWLKMRVSSFELSIATPVKDTGGQNDSARSVHQFLYHEEVGFSNLEGMHLTTNCTSEIENFFLRTGLDVPDIIIEKEKMAKKKKNFTDQEKRYLAEEFTIPQEKAFSVICILSYSAKTGQELRESAEDLYALHSCEIVCADCFTRNDWEETESRDSLEFYDSDDSYNDKDYEQPQSLNGENSTDDSKDSLTENSSLSQPEKDVYEFDEEDKDDFKVYNPFLKIRKQTSEMVNSTFSLTSSGSRIGFSHELSPIDKLKMSTSICPHCAKTFSKNNNLKRHLVSVHKVFPKGVTVFECPVEGCLFTSDNHAHFSRHNHRKSLSNSVKEKCKICGDYFFNNSSLSRHMKRRHS